MGDIYSAKRIDIYDFSGGINEKAGPQALANNQVVNLVNMDVEPNGTLRRRRATKFYIDKSGSVAATEQFIPYSLYFYTNDSGSKQIIAFILADDLSTSVLVADSFNGTFDYLDGNAITSGFPANDRHVSFSQFRDTLYIANDASQTRAYNKDASTQLRAAGVSNYVTDPNSHISDGSNQEGESEGDLDQTKWYTYRYTYTIEVAGEVLGETGPLRSSAGYFGQVSMIADGTGETEDRPGVPGFLPVGMVSLAKTSGSTSLPSFVSQINIYRTFAGTDTIMNHETDDPNFFYLTSISVDDYDATSDGYDLFNDLGYVFPDSGRPLIYERFPEPPKARSIELHKSRLWYGNTSTRSSPIESYRSDRSRVYFSDLNLPEQVSFLNWVDVNPNHGDSIVALKSWMNRVLFVFKSNSIYAIVGADTEVVEGFLDIRVEAIDKTIGCVAPNSVVEFEGGIAWWSNRGPYYFDGSSVKPLAKDMIEKTINRIPSSKLYDICSAYDQDTRHIMFCVCDPAISNRNNTVLKYSLYNGSWSRDTPDIGYASMLSVRSSNVTSRIVCGADEETGAGNTLDTNFNFYLYHDSDNADDNGGSTADDVDWSITSKPRDGKIPDMDKQFIAAFVQYSSGQDIDVDINTDTQYQSSGTGDTATITPSFGTPLWGSFQWNTTTPPGSLWASSLLTEESAIVYFKPGAWGRRAQIVLSGTHTGRTNIQRVIVYYEPMERMRT